MNDVIQQAMANILFNKLMECFDDLECLSGIQTTKEFRIVDELAEKLEQLLKFSNRSPCVDYELVINIWNTLYNDVVKLNDDYNLLILKLVDIYKLRMGDSFQIFGSLIKHDTKVMQKLDGEDFRKFKEYVCKGNEIVRDFRVSLLNYYSSDLTDRFLNNCHVINDNNINYTSIEIKGTSIYLDQNAVSYIANHGKCMEQCLQAKKNNVISFVYSSYLVEDSINMNPLFLEEYLDNLLKITNHQMVGVMENGLCFVTEPISQTIERVKKYSKLTKTFETHRFVKVIEHYHNYPELRKGREFYNEICKDPIKFFNDDGKINIPGFELIERNFGNNQLIADLINSGKVRETTLQEKNKLIEDILNLFDFINFETESVRLDNAKKIYSSYRDNSHLIHACITDYFVTDDAKLKKRGNIIYSLIGSNTKVISSKEFSQLLPKLLSTV